LDWIKVKEVIPEFLPILGYIWHLRFNGPGRNWNPVWNFGFGKIGNS